MAADKPTVDKRTEMMYDAMMMPLYMMYQDKKFPQYSSFHYFFEEYQKYFHDFGKLDKNIRDFAIRQFSIAIADPFIEEKP